MGDANEIGGDRRYLVLDSTAILSELFYEGSLERYKQKIEELKLEGYTPCITPIIYFEIVAKIHEKIRDQRLEETSTLKCKGKQREWGEYHKFFQNLSQLMTDHHCQIIYPGINFSELFEQCDRLRIGPHEKDDRLNIAMAISNKCEIFLTSDEAIYSEKRRIKEISGGKLEIVYIKK